MCMVSPRHVTDAKMRGELSAGDKRVRSHGDSTVFRIVKPAFDAGATSLNSRDCEGSISSAVEAGMPALS